MGRQAKPPGDPPSYRRGKRGVSEFTRCPVTRSDTARMPRRKKTSAAEDLVDLIALLPWWVGLVLATTAFAVLHLVAQRQPEPISAAGQIGPALVATVFRSFAAVGQYVVPLLFVAGSAGSWYRRRVRQQLVDDAASRPASAAFAELNWKQFEQLVGEAFRRQGYSVEETGGGGADGGVDLVLRRHGETHLVQCKQWRAYKVGVQPVRELYGVMAAKGAAGGYVITSGRFTEEAIAFAEGRNLRLLDGVQLKRLIDAPSSKATGPVKADAATPPVGDASRFAVAAPACPVCRRPMLRREARRGAHAGKAFWGCAGYPACRGTRALEEAAG